MRIVKEFEEKVPTWALCYLVNNDWSGIEEEDKELVDKFWDKYQRKADMFNCVVTLNFPDNIDEDKYFSPTPSFGGACDVVDCAVVFMS